MKENSVVVKAGRNFKNSYGSINVPVYRSSTIVFPNLNEYNRAKNEGQSIYDILEDGIERDYSYGSVGTPTYHYLSKAIVDIEGKGNALIYPSGLSALNLVTYTFVKTGDHILIPDSAYFRYKRFVIDELLPMGVDITFYQVSQNIQNLLKSNTKFIMIETPSSVIFEIADVENIVKLAKDNNIITMCDNSYSTPLFFKPLNYGIDIVVYSLTKYFNGHSDLLMGAAVTDQKELFKKLYENYRNYGITVSSDECYLVHRGIRTLHVRMDRYQKNALALASYLSQHPKVDLVLYPALSTHPQHDLWKKYFSGAGGLFSIILKKKYQFQELNTMVSNMNVFALGASWGGCDSLILPSEIDGASCTKYQGSCIRVFCGLEDEEDLIEDFKSALDNL